MTSYVYLGNYSSGVSELLNYDPDGSPSNTDLKKTLTSTLLDDIADKLPEGIKLPLAHPEWMKKSDIHFVEDASQVDLTFIDEGAGFKNAVGYFIYDTNNPPLPQNKNRLNGVDTVYIVFPNASKSGSGGQMNPGDTIRLCYEASVTNVNGTKVATPTNYVFPAGKSIGIVLFANGYSPSNDEVNTSNRKVYSNPDLNIERVEANRYHTVNLKSSYSNDIIIGIEDLNRDRRSDDDFNDCILVINFNPFSAVAAESYTNTSGQIFKGTILLEDQVDQNRFQNNDYNDCIIEYDINETFENQNLKEIDALYYFKHRGSFNDHAFGINIPNIGTKSGTVKVQTITENKNNENNQDTAVDISDNVFINGNNVIELCSSTRSLLPPKNHNFSANTHPNWDSDPQNIACIRVKITFDEPVERTSIDSVKPPYNPYFDVYKWRSSLNRRSLPRTRLLYGVKYPSSFENISLNETYKILVLENKINFKIAKEKSGLYRGYPTLLDYLRNDKKSYSWWLDNRNDNFLHEPFDHPMETNWSGF